MKFPDFIIIGAAKCGTTPLWFNIDKHPDITMAPRRLGKTEMHFWGTKNYKDLGVEWYKKKFKGKISGEKTPTYYGNKRAMLQMKKHIPDVKLILCVRHPVERAYSNYKMNLKSGKVGGSFTWNLLKNRYGQAGKYITFINKNILPLFDKSQIHICVTENMKKNTVEEMNKIYDFLNLDRIELERKRVTINDAYLIKPPSKSMGIRRAEPWYRVWDQYSETVQGDVRNKGLKYYKECNKKLFDFLGYEIEEWRI